MIDIYGIQVFVMIFVFGFITGILVKHIIHDIQSTRETKKLLDLTIQILAYAKVIKHYQKKRVKLLEELKQKKQKRKIYISTN